MAKSDFVIDPHHRSDKSPPEQLDYSVPTDGSDASAPVNFPAGGSEARSFAGNTHGNGDGGRQRFLLDHADAKDLEYGHAISLRIDSYGGPEIHIGGVWLLGSTTSESFASMRDQQEANGESTSNAFSNTQSCMGYSMPVNQNYLRAYLGGWGGSTNWMPSQDRDNAEWRRYRLDIVPSDENDQRVKFVMYKSLAGVDLAACIEADFDDPAKFKKVEYSRDQAYQQGFNSSGGAWGWGFWGSGMRVGFAVHTDATYNNQDRRPAVDNFECRIVDCRTELGL